jgi:hypothetical protein
MQEALSRTLPARQNLEATAQHPSSLLLRTPQLLVHSPSKPLFNNMMCTFVSNIIAYVLSLRLYDEFES